MVILLEPTCGSWVHEEVNAGFLQLVVQNSKQKVMFIGEERHVHCVKRIYHQPEVVYKTIKDPVAKNDSDLYKNFFYYYRLLRSVLKEFKINQLFILCGYRPCILAAELIAVVFPKARINFVIHGMVEETNWHYRSYARLFWISRYIQNLRFVTYSPYCTGQRWNIQRDKFVFLDHPYVEAALEKGNVKKQETDKIVIGIIGACANDKAMELITMINRRRLGERYEVWVASKYAQRFKYLKNVRKVDIDFKRENMEKLMLETDYLLLPYGKEEYALSASGVLWDAIVHRIPCFMLDSPYLKYYNQYKIGYQEDTVEKLCDVICDIVQNGKKKEDFFVDLAKINKQRNETIKKMLE